MEGGLGQGTNPILPPFWEKIWAKNKESSIFYPTRRKYHQIDIYRYLQNLSPVMGCFQVKYSVKIFCYYAAHSAVIINIIYEVIIGNSSKEGF